jgi:peptide/nickel transport system permease protein
VTSGPASVGAVDAPAGAQPLPAGDPAAAPDVPVTSGDTRRRAVSLWAGYLARRLAGAAGVLLVIILLTFMIVRWVPGDPARQIVGLNAGPEQVQQVREQLGLNQSFWTQFGHYVGGLFSGDLGSSFVNQQPVSQMLAQRLPLTAQLAVSALVIVLILGFIFGITAGVLEHGGRGRAFTTPFTAATSLVGAMPEYITGTLLVYVFALTLEWLPVQGGSGFRQMLLPAIAVALPPAAVLARLVRNETLGVLSQEYITTATSKRLSRPRLLLRHVFPNVITSTLTLGGLLLVALLGGTVITENVFNISGLGTEVVQSILRSDYPSVQGIILVLGAIAVVINLAVDVTLGLLDPRVLTRRAS